METLYFITAAGVCGHTEEWDAETYSRDASDWLDQYGDRIGSGAAPLPTGGWIDLSQFASITMERQS